MRTPAADSMVMIALHGLVTSKAEVDFFLRPLMWGFPVKGVRWVVPKAPLRPVTLLGGQPARAWYDLVNWDPQCKDADGIEAAACAVQQIVDKEKAKGVRPEQIVLAGFSQGGQLALHAGLRLHGSIGAVVSLSAALPFPDQIPSAEETAPPIFMAHGLLDSVVPSSWGSDSASLLESKGYQVSWRGYPIGHTVSWQELGDVAAWLESRVASRSAGRAAAAPRVASAQASERSREYAAQAV
jgi:phospholipase/carboxylesterase